MYGLGSHRGPRQGGLVRMGVRKLAGGIGLASEATKDRKGSKTSQDAADEAAASQSYESSRSRHNSDSKIDTYEDGAPPAYDYTEDTSGQASDRKESYGEEHGDDLENEWKLDDAQDEIIGQTLPTGSSNEAQEDIFLRHYQALSNIPNQHQGLPFPVVLPQRRPADRSRGFIRAYAPVLENCGIDQPAWIAFLDSFQKDSAASPWLNAINFAAIGTMFMPHVAGLAAGYAIQQVANMAIEIQGRERTNKFLTKINEEFFRPRGLYCLVMTWNPRSSRTVEQVNLTDTVVQRTDASGLSGVASKFRASDGTTYSNWEFPETAPLIFPGLDNLAASTSKEGEKKKSDMANGLKYVANYWDKRATAEFAMKNPNALLAQVPQGEFKSRYADPANRAASGSVIAFVSGGHLIPNPESRGLIGGLFNVAAQAVRGEKQGSGWTKEMATESYNEKYRMGCRNPYSRYYGGRDCDRQNWPGARATSTGTNPVTALKKVLKQDVLYMMVVNMPSDEEMAAARARMGR